MAARSRSLSPMRHEKTKHQRLRQTPVQSPRRPILPPRRRRVGLGASHLVRAVHPSDAERGHSAIAKRPGSRTTDLTGMPPGSPSQNHRILDHAPDAHMETIDGREDTSSSGIQDSSHLALHEADRAGEGQGSWRPPARSHTPLLWSFMCSSTGWVRFSPGRPPIAPQGVRRRMASV